jgi:hypothetical protein
MTNSAGGQRLNREWVNAWLGTDLPVFFCKYLQL